MKPIQLNKILFLSFLVLAGFAISSCCKNRVHGTYLIPNEAKKYLPDTNITSFEMIDNNGITDAFLLNDAIFYQPFMLYSKWGDEDKCGDAFITESFRAEYNSTINQYYFKISIRAGIDHTTIETDWGPNDRFEFYFETKEFISELKPSILLIDSMTVNQKTYSNIILFDNSSILSQIDIRTPVKFYIAGDYGLIKFETRQGIIYERVKK